MEPSISPKAALYIRVSTQEQFTEGFGLDAQKSKLQNYVSNRDLEWSEDLIFSDVHSGSEYHRLGLQAMISAIKEGKVNTIVVYKIDRLSRSLKHLLEIFEVLSTHQVNLISLQENLDFNGPFGNFVFQMFGAFAQFERELIKTRTRSGVISSAEMGNFTGSRIPFGYMAVSNPSGKGKKLQLHPEDRPWADKIFRWYIYEEMGDLAIAKRLNQLQVLRNGKKVKWTSKAIEGIIKNTLYRGEYVASKRDGNGNILPMDDWTIVQIPPIVDEITFSLAIEARNQRHAGYRKRKFTYLCSGKIIDVSTSERRKFIGRPRTKGGRSYVRPPFTDSKGVDHPTFVIPAKTIEDEVWNKIKLALKDPKAFIEYYNSQLDKSVFEHTQTDLENQLNAIREKKMQLALQTGRIEEAYEQNLYSIEKMHQKLEVIDEQRNELLKLETELTDQLMGLYHQHETFENIRSLKGKYRENIDQVDESRKKLFIQMFVHSIQVNRTRLKSPKGRLQWEREMKIIFRFDSREGPGSPPLSTTLNSDGNGAEKGLKSKNRVSGGEGSYKYYQISFRYRFLYRIRNGKRMLELDLC